MKYASVPYAAKHQLILPLDHHAVKLLVLYLHQVYKHVGTEHLLSIIRQEFWIVKARKLINKISRTCIKCQKFKSATMENKMANLPKDRVTIAEPPFYNTGIDYFGPIMVKILRSRVKRWGCIFTCMATRAVHLEVAPSMETDDFLNVLERFINRRGCPKMIRSDNGSNFKGAKSELDKELEKMNQLEIDAFTQRKNIEWKFNTPEAPHMGGTWERLIRSIKSTLKIILSEQVVNDFVLVTLFTKAEALINSRPLTYVSNDVNDLEALTPSHFLIGRPNNNLSPCVTYEKDVTHRKRWKQVNALTQQFWNRWMHEYLPLLTKRGKWLKEEKSINVGDMVIIKDATLSRGKWPLARISKIFPSKDCIVRSVEVTTKSSKYLRPITKLIKLDVNGLW